MAYKLGYIFFKCLGESLDLNFSYEFKDGVRFKRKIPSIKQAKWREWLGLQWENVVTSNAVVEAKTETQKPEVLDEENKKLEFECRELWVSLMLTGPFYLENAYFLTGSEIEDKAEIRQFFRFDRWFHPGDDFVREMLEADVSKWRNLFRQIKKIYTQEEIFLRFKRGLHCFLKGCSESQVNFRLPYFVRSLEALIIPDIGKTAKQFKKRTAKWWKVGDTHFSEDPLKTLTEIYDIRCKFEHMHDLEADLIERQLLRSYQCEEVVRNAYHSILSNDAELNKFSTDMTIKEYWRSH